MVTISIDGRYYSSYISITETYEDGTWKTLTAAREFVLEGEDGARYRLNFPFGVMTIKSRKKIGPVHKSFDGFKGVRMTQKRYCGNYNTLTVPLSCFEDVRIVEDNHEDRFGVERLLYKKISFKSGLCNLLETGAFRFTHDHNTGISTFIAFCGTEKTDKGEEIDRWRKQLAADDINLTSDEVIALLDKYRLVRKRK